MTHRRGHEAYRVSSTNRSAETPIFSRGVPVDVGESWSGDISVTLTPTGSLQTEIGVRHSTIRRQRDGSTYSTATIPRVRVQYQFTKAWYLRTILEYGSQEAAELRDPETGEPLYACVDECEARDGATDNDLYGDILLGYEPSPGTVFYLGYTRQMRDSDAFRFRDINAVAVDAGTGERLGVADPRWPWSRASGQAR